MKGVARYFFTLAVIYALVGMALGLHMGISNVHDQIPTHAHIMLAGWVTSALIAYFYHQFPKAAESSLAMVHFLVQTVGAIVMMISLWFIYGGNQAFEPGAGIGSTAFFIGMAMFAYISLKTIWQE
jgi:uncharacterized protein involved in response to NO